MAFEHNISRGISLGSRSIGAGKQYTGDISTSFSLSIPDSSTEYDCNFTLDLGNGLVSLFILSDQVITLKTNTYATPDDTLVLVANVPYIWHTGWYDTTLFATVDILELNADNASGSAATLQIETLIDAVA